MENSLVMHFKTFPQLSFSQNKLLLPEGEISYLIFRQHNFIHCLNLSMLKIILNLDSFQNKRFNKLF